MIIVRIELWSAVTREVTELARMKICNVGGTHQRCDYEAVTFRGRDRAALDRETVQRSCRVENAGDDAERSCRIENYPRLAVHVWNLVARALDKMGYGQ